jgi:hypothetical protein
MIILSTAKVEYNSGFIEPCNGRQNNYRRETVKLPKGTGYTTAKFRTGEKFPMLQKSIGTIF